MQISFGLIKPEAVPHWSDIVAFIESRGFVIVEPTWIEWRSPSLTRSIMRTLYPGAPEPIITETTRRFFKQTTPFFKIAGTNAVQRFYEACGTDVDPRFCGEHTIRRKFGNNLPVQFLAKGIWYTYWENAIHRPQNAAELERDLGIFYEKTRALA